MTCCLNKNIYSRSKNWVSLIKSVEIRQKRAVRPYYANLYAYAGNNPITYTDPDGRTEVYFIYVYKTDNPDDQDMKASERNSINQEIKYLQEKGVSVKVIENGTYSDIKAALEDSEIKILITSGHGFEDGGIETSDEKKFSPSDLENINVSESLETVIFENCHQGGSKGDTNSNEKAWETAFNNKVDVVGWKGITTVPETKRFNGWGWFDRQKENLMGYLKSIFNKEEFKNWAMIDHESLSN